MPDDFRQQAEAQVQGQLINTVSGTSKTRSSAGWHVDCQIDQSETTRMPVLDMLPMAYWVNGMRPNRPAVGVGQRVSHC